MGCFVAEGVAGVGATREQAGLGFDLAGSGDRFGKHLHQFRGSVLAYAGNALLGLFEFAQPDEFEGSEDIGFGTGGWCCGFGAFDFGHRGGWGQFAVFGGRLVFQGSHFRGLQQFASQNQGIAGSGFAAGKLGIEVLAF